MAPGAASGDEGLEFAKGHGTANDFVLLPDSNGVVDLDPALVRALCDRRTGIGADGVLRVVPTALAVEPEVVAQADEAAWFMDYRNADGSAAQMCGNGIRVFVRYLLDRGWVSGTTVPVATRSGVVPVTVEPSGLLAAELGPFGLPDGGEPPYVVVGDRRWPAMAVTMPNPHAVVFVDSLTEAGVLLEAPELLPAGAFPEGANVEFVVVDEPGHLSMRVHERGVGETQSCGTGACAAVVAARRRVGLGEQVTAPAEWTVDVPGGRLRVTERPSGRVELAGPAVLVGSGRLSRTWTSQR